MTEGGEHQLELTLPGVSPMPRTSRLWIMAPESRVAPRTSDDGETLNLDHAARHCFISAERGLAALGASDLLLVRCSEPERFQLLLPEGLIADEKAKGDLTRWIERALRRGNLSGLRAQTIDHLTCVTFARGQNPYIQTERHLRSRLERALARLGNSLDATSPTEALHEYRVARRLLDGRSHNAIDGLIRHARAGALGRIHAATGETECGAESRAQFANASNLYTKVGLRSEARTADRNSVAQAARLQCCLPFYREDQFDELQDNTARITPIVAMAVTLPALDIALPRKRSAVPQYESAGYLSVRDIHLCRLLAGDRSGQRKLVAKVEPNTKGYTINAGHADAMTALLRLAAVSPNCDDVLALTFSSSSLDFDQPMLIATTSRPAQVVARPTEAGPHAVDISMHMRDGRTATLPFSIPDKIERMITYV